MSFVRRLEDLGKLDLPLAGGKGANLGEIINAGLPVPPGFCVTTPAYAAFVDANGIGEKIRAVLDSLRTDDPESLDTASESIRGFFSAGAVPREMSAEILKAYAGMDGVSPGIAGIGSVPVAVRSSATAEDLPDLSFAGQQDTYLNIVGPDSLIDAIVRCWASLWTARAIGYRARNGVAQEGIALAVVVQAMVRSEAAGVLFTVNPLTGKRGETVIDATIGLGEALVSGQVEPDHYVVARNGGGIVGKTLGKKGLSIRPKEGGGTITDNAPAQDRQALPDDQILALARLGRIAETHFGGPQDMEWAWADGKLSIVQSRPVTSLFPLPEGDKAEPLETLLSFGVWQGMLDPYTPLGQDMMAVLVAGMGKAFGSRIEARDQRVFQRAGERLFVNLTGVLKSSFGRKAASIFLGSIDPVSAAIIDGLIANPIFGETKSMSLASRLKLARFGLGIVSTVLPNLVSPRRGRARLTRIIERSLDEVRRGVSSAGSLAELLDSLDSLMSRMPGRMIPLLVGGIASGQMPYQILLRQVGGLPGAAELLMDLTRGLPHNVTTEMDLALWRTAQAIRKDAASSDFFRSSDASSLSEAFKAEKLPFAAGESIRAFMDSYGMRGVGEIDLGRLRWSERPESLLLTLQSYLRMDVKTSPETIFERGAETARRAMEGLERLARENREAPPPRLVRAMTMRFRELGGLRETPKFFFVRMLSQIRVAIQAAGRRMVEEGTLCDTDDLFFLHLWELRKLTRGELGDPKALIADRRAAYSREFRRKRIPRVLLSDGTSFFDAPPTVDDGDCLSGSPVSAGVVEGRVRVVLDPHGTQILPGEILVCPATDPAWTPLFLAAGGLVMEVGGMMTHGSVVAREYGIPAMVGVSQATLLLKDGQRVRVDGAAGKVTILD